MFDAFSGTTTNAHLNELIISRIPFATKDTERSTRNPLSLLNVSQVERPAPLRWDVVLALYVKPRSWHQQHLKYKSTGCLGSGSPGT